MKGSILDSGEQYYTYLGGIFKAIQGEQKNYNWLITKYECYPQGKNADKFVKEYCWISGDELTQIVEDEDFQWIWGTLSGFEKHISLQSILEHPLPEADGYTGFWKNPVTIQHPFADIEIVAWDSELTLFISKDDSLVNQFQQYFPQSQDLYKYNEIIAQQG